MAPSQKAFASRSSAPSRVYGVADRLRRLRQQLGISQQELAAKLGVSRAQLGRWESGAASPSAQNWYRIAGLESEFRAEQPARTSGDPLPAAAGRALEPPSRRAIPVPLTSFVGRETEIAELLAVLRLPATRLLTLTGGGGSGKTRMAIELAGAAADCFRDGVCFAELAAISDPADVLPLVARAAGVPDQPGRSTLDALLDELLPLEVLLVLDNCEHLAEATANLAASILPYARDVTLLATSREALSVPGELRRPVLPLTFPRDEAQLDSENSHQFQAMQLFVERARLRRPQFTVDSQTAAALGEIRRRLEGSPLAIELAAARIDVLSPRQIADRLEERLELLVAGDRSVPERQRTLRAALDWSYQLLAADEQAFFARLSVFPTTFSLAASAALGPGRIDDPDLDLALLSRLVDKSLVTVDYADGPRFRLPETVRDYARERLARSEELEITRERHARFFQHLAGDAEQALVGTQQTAWHHALDLEHDNLRAALEWAFHSPAGAELAFDLVRRLRRHWLIRGYHSEGLAWSRRALAAWPQAAPSLRAGAELAAGSLSLRNGDRVAAEAHARTALELARVAGSARLEADSIFLLANTLIAHDRAEAGALFRQAGEMFELLGDARGCASCSIGSAQMDLALGVRDRAAAAIQASLEIYRALGDRDSEGLALSYLAPLAFAEGDSARAEELTRQALRLVWEVGNRHVAATNLVSLASMFVLRELTTLGCELFGAGDALAASIGSRISPAISASSDRQRRLAEQKLGSEGYAAALERGRALPIDGAIALALSTPGPVAAALVATPTAQPNEPATATEEARSLTQRENEILLLLARGHTNREIATALTLSVHTVERHVANIFRKLSVTRRGEAIIYARERLPSATL